MKQIGYIVAGLGGLVALVALAFVLELGGLQWERFFAPRYEAVRREVFTNTRSFNEAKLQDLVRYRLQYQQAKTRDDKAAIAAAVRIAYAEYEASRLPVELAGFLRTCKYGE